MERIEIEILEDIVKIPNSKGELMDCQITGAEPVDERSVHIITDRGIFLINIDECRINGMDIIDINDLMIQIPEKKQTNPN